MFSHLASWIYPSSSQTGSAAQSKQQSTNSTPLKIDQVFSKHDLPPDLVHSNSNSRDGEASTSSDKSTRSGFFSVASLASDNANKLTPNTMQLQKYIPTKIIELPSSARLANPVVITNSNKNLNPLPLKISSVASGEEVTLMTNGFSDADNDIDDEDDDDIDMMHFHPEISNVRSLANNASNSEADPLDTTRDELTTAGPSDFSDLNIKLKTESIDLSDDEKPRYFDIVIEKKAITKLPLNDGVNSIVKGYIYCATNTQMGKVNIEWTTPNSVKLHLAEPTDIEFNGSNDYRDDMAEISKFMHKYIRERFYGVYPAYLQMDWIFVKVNDDKECGSSLGDFNDTEPFSVRSIHANLPTFNRLILFIFSLIN